MKVWQKEALVLLQHIYNIFRHMKVWLKQAFRPEKDPKGTRNLTYWVKDRIKV